MELRLDVRVGVLLGLVMVVLFVYVARDEFFEDWLGSYNTVQDEEGLEQELVAVWAGLPQGLQLAPELESSQRVVFALFYVRERLRNERCQSVSGDVGAQSDVEPHEGEEQERVLFVVAVVAEDIRGDELQASGSDAIGWEAAEVADEEAAGIVNRQADEALD